MKTKPKLGRPTKDESIAIQYIRSARSGSKKSKQLKLFVGLSPNTKEYADCAPFLNALRQRSHGVLSLFLREAVVKAVNDITRKS
jgi:hypothetical protein